MLSRLSPLRGQQTDKKLEARVKPLTTRRPSVIELGMKIFTVVLLALYLSLSLTHAEESAFSKPTIDLGVVVTDLEASLEFYTEAIGFTRAGSFTVAPGIVNGAGLSEVTEEIEIQKLQLGKGDGATTLKLMQFGKPGKSDQTHINSTAGFSYLTIFVTDIKASIARAAEQGAKPLKQGPVDLGGGKVFLAVFKDPDGNFVELVGP